MKKIIKLSLVGLLIAFVSTSCQKNITASFGSSATGGDYTYISKKQSKKTTETSQESPIEEDSKTIVTEKENAFIAETKKTESTPKEELKARVTDIKGNISKLTTNKELTKSETKELKKEIKSDLKELKSDLKASAKSKNDNNNTFLIVLVVLALLVLLGVTFIGELLYIALVILLIYLLLMLLGIV